MERVLLDIQFSSTNKFIIIGSIITIVIYEENYKKYRSNQQWK